MDEEFERYRYLQLKKKRAESQARPEEIQPSEEKSFLGNVGESLATSMPALYPTYKTLTEPETAKSFYKGALSGATFETMGREPLEGSVLEPYPTSRKVGKFAGAAVPIVASAMTGGSAFGIGATARGLSPLAISIMEGMGTGLTHGAIKGAVRNQPIGETLSESATEGSIFAGLGAAGNFLGYMRKQLGEKFPEWLSNNFINTKSDIAMKLREQGRPSLGKQYLEKTKLPGFKSRNEVYDEAGSDLFQTENRIGGRLQENLEKLTTPTPTRQVTGKPLALPYKPSSVQVNPTNPMPFEGQGTISPRPNPPGGARVGGRSTGDPELVSLPAKEFETAGRTGGFGGGMFAPQTPAELAIETAQKRELRQFAARKYGLKETSPELWESGTREGAINTVEIAKSLDDVIEGFSTGTHPGEMARIKNLQSSFIKNNPKKLTLIDAMGLKRKLDDRVSRAYLATEGKTIPVSAEIDEALANELRRKIYEIDPVLGELAANESLMLKIRAGLLPKVAGVGGQRFNAGVLPSVTNRVFGSSTANLTAKTLKETMGKPSKFISPVTKQSARTLTELLDEDKR